jgi:hypothetical protein
MSGKILHGSSMLPSTDVVSHFRLVGGLITGLESQKDSHNSSADTRSCLYPIVFISLSHLTIRGSDCSAGPFEREPDKAKVISIMPSGLNLGKTHNGLRSQS